MPLHTFCANFHSAPDTYVLQNKVFTRKWQVQSTMLQNLDKCSVFTI